MKEIVLENFKDDCFVIFEVKGNDWGKIKLPNYKAGPFTVKPENEYLPFVYFVNQKVTVKASNQDMKEKILAEVKFPHWFNFTAWDYLNALSIRLIDKSCDEDDSNDGGDVIQPN
jgi:hypothetical protein